MSEITNCKTKCQYGTCGGHGDEQGACGGCCGCLGGCISESEGQQAAGRKENIEPHFLVPVLVLKNT